MKITEKKYQNFPYLERVKLNGGNRKNPLLIYVTKGGKDDFFLPFCRTTIKLCNQIFLIKSELLKSLSIYHKFTYQIYHTKFFFSAFKNCK